MASQQLPAAQQQPDNAAASDSEEDEELESEEEGLEYMLGFAEPPARPADLLRHHFPSKLGGRPAWLDPVNLPPREQLTCSATGRPLNFLLQVYAPLDEEAATEEAFHRTIFLFISPEGSALAKQGAIRALRCQLPRKNPFYSYEPPKPGDTAPMELPAAAVERSLAADPWRVLEAEALASQGTAAGEADTGARAGKRSDCQEASASTSGRTAGLAPGLHLYPELELAVEPEDRESEQEEQDMARLLREYEARVEAEGELTEEDAPPELLDQVQASCPHESRHFAMFQARMACAPSQVIRYCFKEGARPLWPSPKGLPAPEDIPACRRCGAPRRFEFQVMPQLLNHLQQDEMDSSALDWGTLVVYACSRSCGAAGAGGAAGSSYAEEFVWMQPT